MKVNIKYALYREQFEEFMDMHKGAVGAYYSEKRFEPEQAYKYAAWVNSISPLKDEENVTVYVAIGAVLNYFFHLNGKHALEDDAYIMLIKVKDMIDDDYVRDLVNSDKSAYLFEAMIDIIREGADIL